MFKDMPPPDSGNEHTVEARWNSSLGLFDELRDPRTSQHSEWVRKSGALMYRSGFVYWLFGVTKDTDTDELIVHRRCINKHGHFVDGGAYYAYSDAYEELGRLPITTTFAELIDWLRTTCRLDGYYTKLEVLCAKPSDV